MVPELVLARSLERGKGDDGNAEALQTLYRLRERLCAELIALSSRDAAGRLGIAEEFKHGHIVRRRSYAAVYKLNGKTRKPLSVVAVAYTRQPCALGRRALCIAVAGQVDEIQLFVYRVEVDGYRLSGGRADAGERAASHHCVDERALTDVRATRERDLRSAVAHKLTRLSRNAEKLDVIHIYIGAVHSFLPFCFCFAVLGGVLSGLPSGSASRNCLSGLPFF